MKNNYEKIPAPNIKFDAKSELKRKSSYGMVIRISSAVAAMLVIGTVFIFNNQPCDVYVAKKISETVFIDSIKVNELVENKNEEELKAEMLVNEVSERKTNTKQNVKVETPPPIESKKFDTILRNLIETPRKREKFPQITMRTNLIMANIEVEHLKQVVVEKNAIEEVDKKPKFVLNSNLQRFVDDVKNRIEETRFAEKREKVEIEINPHLKNLFNSDAQVEFKFMSKIEE